VPISEMDGFRLCQEVVFGEKLELQNLLNRHLSMVRIGHYIHCNFNTGDLEPFVVWLKQINTRLKGAGHATLSKFCSLSRPKDIKQRFLNAYKLVDALGPGFLCSVPLLKDRKGSIYGRMTENRRREVLEYVRERGAGGWWSNHDSILKKKLGLA